MDLPWELRDLVRLAYLGVAGLLGIAVCWYGISGAATVHDQLPWLVGGSIALIVGGIGMIGWLLSGIRRVHAEALEVVTAVRDERLPDAALSATAVEQVAGGLVIAAQMSRAHYAGCVLVEGKQVAPITVEEITARGLGYCKVCCG